ncbi:transcriptional regulator Pcc1 [Schizosaccharomyces octosporus yFS286]|uniref:Transcriptional regulator Pcc1 n=1 Tax=Schizosaccharomyces octosporus (strain yFS286) TaxID=483514 RepID=S9R6F6_SCHOY|nr:transcriptional regulator Pcc1 [Schizosaccharomyces octosporus yFS286]EPX73890.1 transcriptional regulator Pcc1 [Schizosaccharomyces octosporus yFS286]
MDSLPHKVEVRVPFPSEQDAKLCMQVLAPDRELKEDQVARILSLEGNYLVAKYFCSSARMTRVTLNSFFENLHLVVDSMHELSSL